MANKNLVARATGAAAIALSVTPPDEAIEIISVKLNLSAAGGAAEDFTVTINSATAAVYDTIIFAQDMNAVQDLMWLPERPVPVVNKDVVDFAYANTNTRTYGLEVIYKRA
jgi:hypothetical protein